MMKMSEEELLWQDTYKDTANSDNKRLKAEQELKRETKMSANPKMNIVDGLRLQNMMLEIIEELKIRRNNDIENEERVKWMAQEKYELERKYDNEVARISSLQEKHQMEIGETEKLFADKVRKLEAEVKQHQTFRDCVDKEVNALKDDYRKLQMTKFSLEKKLKDQDRRLQLQVQSTDQHLGQLSEAEQKFHMIQNHSKQLSDSQDRLNKNVKEATKLNQELMYINKHQKCVIRQQETDIKDLQNKLVQVNSQLHHEPTDTLQAGYKDKISALNTELQEKELNNAKLIDENIVLEKKYQGTLQRLQDSHKLIERHLQNARAYKEEVTLLENLQMQHKSQLSTLKSDLESLTKELADQRDLHNNAERTWQEKEEELKEQQKNLKDELVKQKDTCSSLEDLNSDWSKRNLQLSEQLRDAQALLNKVTIDAEHQTDLSMLSTADTECQTQIQCATVTSQTLLPDCTATSCQTTSPSIISVSSQTKVPAMTNFGTQTTVTSTDQSVQTRPCLLEIQTYSFDSRQNLEQRTPTNGGHFDVANTILHGADSQERQNLYHADGLSSEKIDKIDVQCDTMKTGNTTGDGLDEHEFNDISKLRSNLYNENIADVNEQNQGSTRHIQGQFGLLERPVGLDHGPAIEISELRNLSSRERDSSLEVNRLAQSGKDNLGREVTQEFILDAVAVGEGQGQESELSKDRSIYQVQRKLDDGSSDSSDDAKRKGSEYLRVNPNLEEGKRETVLRKAGGVLEYPSGKSSSGLIQNTGSSQGTSGTTEQSQNLDEDKMQHKDVRVEIVHKAVKEYKTMDSSDRSEGADLAHYPLEGGNMTNSTPLQEKASISCQIRSALTPAIGKDACLATNTNQASTVEETNSNYEGRDTNLEAKRTEALDVVERAEDRDQNLMYPTEKHSHGSELQNRKTELQLQTLDNRKRTGRNWTSDIAAAASELSPYSKFSLKLKKISPRGNVPQIIMPKSKDTQKSSNQEILTKGILKVLPTNEIKERRKTVSFGQVTEKHFESFHHSPSSEENSGPLRQTEDPSDIANQYKRTIQEILNQEQSKKRKTE